MSANPHKKPDWDARSRRDAQRGESDRFVREQRTRRAQPAEPKPLVDERERALAWYKAQQ